MAVPRYEEDSFSVNEEVIDESIDYYGANPRSVCSTADMLNSSKMKEWIQVTLGHNLSLCLSHLSVSSEVSLLKMINASLCFTVLDSQIQY